MVTHIFGFQVPKTITAFFLALEHYDLRLGPD